MSSASAAAPAAAKPAKAAAKGGKKTKYTIDLTIAEKDKLLKSSDFETFLRSNIKVDNKKGNLQAGKKGSVEILRSGSRVTVESTTAPFAKRYFKWLTKKYLQKNELRDYLRVVASASNKNGYDLRYYKMNQGGEEEEEA